MCVMSMIEDHYGDKWRPYTWPPHTTPGQGIGPYVPPEPPISDAEIREFRKLLERARQYDIDHGEPECELDEKKEMLLKIAEQLGLEIDFL